MHRHAAHRRLKVVRVIQSADGITQLHVNVPSVRIWEITSARGFLGHSPTIAGHYGRRNVLCVLDRKHTRSCFRALTCRIVACGKSDSMNVLEEVAGWRKLQWYSAAATQRSK